MLVVSIVPILSSLLLLLRLLLSNQVFIPMTLSGQRPSPIKLSGESADLTHNSELSPAILT